MVSLAFKQSFTSHYGKYFKLLYQGAPKELMDKNVENLYSSIPVLKHARDISWKINFLFQQAFWENIHIFMATEKSFLQSFIKQFPL